MTNKINEIEKLQSLKNRQLLGNSYFNLKNCYSDFVIALGAKYEQIGAKVNDSLSFVSPCNNNEEFSKLSKIRYTRALVIKESADLYWKTVELMHTLTIY